jgi:hypothetical protein
MKPISKYVLFFLQVVIVAVSGCSDDDPAVSVYMPDGNKIVNANFDVSDTVYYTAAVVGSDYPTSSADAAHDMTVGFKVDRDKVASFNALMGTNYQLLPVENYSFDASAIIAKDNASTAPLKLIVKNGDQLQPFSSFLLPISIETVAGGTGDEIQQTTYFILTRSPAIENLPTLDRTAWTIKDMSSEEPNEGGGNGLAVASIDGNPASYWHSKWAGSEPPPPHYVTIDLGAVVELHGIAIVDRDLGDWGHGQPKSMTVHVSNDGVNFESAGTFTSVPMKSNPPEQIRYLLSSTKNARYLKVTVTGTWGDTNSTSIAEIYAL